MSAWAPPDADPVRPRAVVVGVDGTERSADAVALGELVAETLGTEFRLFRVRSSRHLERALRSNDYRAEALVLGSSNRGLTGRALRGRARHRLLSSATCPILVSPEGYAAGPQQTIGHIGVGFDGSPESRAAWIQACRIAQVTGAALHVYAIRQTHAFGAAAGPALGADLGGLDQEVAQFLQRQLIALVTGAPSNLFIVPVMRTGDPTTILRELAGSLDLLVIGSRGLGGIASVLLGSVSARLTGDVDCPLMVVPQGCVPNESSGSVADSISESSRAQRASG